MLHHSVQPVLHLWTAPDGLQPLDGGSLFSGVVSWLWLCESFCGSFDCFAGESESSVDGGDGVVGLGNCGIGLVAWGPGSGGMMGAWVREMGARRR